MQLRLGFNLDAGLIQSAGEALIHLSFSANQGRAVVKVKDLKIDASSSTLEIGARLLSQPLRNLIAQQLSAAINQAILDLPQQEPYLKQVEILDIQD